MISLPQWVSTSPRIVCAAGPAAVINFWRVLNFQDLFIGQIDGKGSLWSWEEVSPQCSLILCISPCNGDMCNQKRMQKLLVVKYQKKEEISSYWVESSSVGSNQMRVLGLKRVESVRNEVLTRKSLCRFPKEHNLLLYIVMRGIYQSHNS